MKLFSKFGYIYNIDSEMEYKIKSHFYTHIFIVVVFMSFIPGKIYI